MSASIEPMHIGLISFAHPHAESYARILRDRPGIRLTVTDPEPYDPGTSRGRELARSLGVDYVDSVAELLAARPTGVIVTAENSRHREFVELAALAGADVLCEKPLATELADAEAMLDAVALAGTSLMTAYPVRFAPEFEELRHALRSGALGEVLAVSGTNNGKIPIGDRSWFTDPARSGGGALVDHIVHCADLLDALLAEPAVEVHAVANRVLHARHGVSVETGGLVSVRYASGVIATIDCSWSQPDTADTWGGLTLDVQGTKGSMRIDPFAAHVAGYGADGSIWHPFGVDLDALMIDEFLEAIRSGHRPSPSGAVGLRTLAIVDAAQRSVASGAPVAVALVSSGEAA